MSLLTFAIAGSVVALLMMLGGLLWLGARRELQVSRMSPEAASELVHQGWQGWPIFRWFRGLASGVSFYAEKPTRDIIALMAAGNWGEALPWAIPALGVVAAAFFWPLLVGVLTGLQGVLLWGLVAVFFIGCLMAAWPRDEDKD